MSTNDEQQKTFDEITSRLDEIVETVRAKDTSLEHSLDLFDEAIRLGNEAVEMVDQVDILGEDAEDEDAAEGGEDVPGAAEDALAADAPAADAPAADAPAADTPAVDTPAADTPADDASPEE